MFIPISSVANIMDNNIRYYTEAKELGLGDDEYYAKMESKLKHQLEYLKRNSCNKTLIAKYERKLNKLGII